MTPQCSDFEPENEAIAALTATADTTTTSRPTTTIFLRTNQLRDVTRVLPSLCERRHSPGHRLATGHRSGGYGRADGSSLKRGDVSPHGCGSGAKKTRRVNRDGPDGPSLP